MASIYKRGSTWTANVFIMKDGQRRRKTKSGFRTKAEANGWAMQTEADKVNQTLVLPNKISFPDAFDNWYQTYKEPTLSAATKRWYRFTSGVLHERFNNVRLSSMDRHRFQSFLNDFGKTHAIETARKIKMHVHQMAEAAIIDEKLSKDFTASTKVTGSDGKSSDMKFLEADDMKKLVDHINERPVVTRPVTDMMILTALHTGARYSEIAGLTWTDIDFDNSQVSINKTWDMVNKEFKGTKTKGSNRTIDVPTVLVEQLLEWRKVHPETVFVFQGKHAYPPTNNAANKQLEQNLKQIEAEKIITFHGLRHTHASWLLSQGVDVKYVSERLGHSGIEITLSTYTHLLDHERKDEAQRSVNLLNNL